MPRKPRDVDGGWAWVILAGVTMWNFIIGGAYKITGVMYVEFLDLFHEGPITTSYLGLSFSLVAALVSVLGGYAADNMAFQRLRILMVFNGLMAALGTAAAGYMPTFAGTIVSYGVITALFGGFNDPPSLSLLGLYFEDRRTIAASIATSGDSLATLILPPLLTYLVQVYTLRGAMLLYAGIWLHCLIVPAMMLPIKRRGLGATVEMEVMPDGTLTSNYEVKEEPECRPLNQGNNMATFNGDVMCVVENQSHVLTHDQLGEQSLLNSRGESKLQDGDNTKELANNTLLDNLECIEVDKGDSQTNCIINNQSTPNCITEPDSANTLLPKDNIHEIECAVKHSGDISSDDGVNRFIHFFISIWELFSTPGIIPLSLSLSCGFFGSFNMFFVLPPLAQELGMSRLEGALLTALPSITEFIGRIAMGPVVDIAGVPKETILIVSYAVSGCLATAVSFFNDPDVYLAYAVIYGLLGGMVTPLCVPMLMDIVRVEQHGAAASLLPLLQCIPTAIGPPILSAIADYTGSFANSLRLCAGMYFLGLVVYMYSYAMKRIRRRNTNGQDKLKT